MMDEQKQYNFKNIGPIRNAGLDLGGLTIIAGANNSGKTYIAYTLYNFRKYISEELEVYEHFSKVLDADKFYSEQENGIITGTVAATDIRAFIIKYLKNIGKMFSGEKIAESFAAPLAEFANSEVSVYKSDFDFTKMSDMHANFRTMKMTISLKDDFFCYVFEPTENEKIAEISSDHLAYYVLSRIMRNVIPITPAVIFVAERLGISLFYKELDFTKSRLVEMIQKISNTTKNRDEQITQEFSKRSARYAQPIKDNIDYTRDLDTVQKQTSTLSEKNLFGDIRIMMGAYYKYVSNSVYFISTKRKKDSFRIPLHMASTSARCLSELYFYMKHVAKKGQLLIIDEPESHLDTVNQILMARLLARCVNAGVRVLITTHSDYIIKEFNNLIMLGQLPKNSSQKDKILKRFKKQYTEEDVLADTAVRAYICENGGLTSCKVDSRGMDIELFDKTIDEINEISFALDSCLPRISD